MMKNGKIELSDDMIEQVNGGNTVTDCLNWIGKLFLVRLGFAKIFNAINLFK